MTIDLKKIVGVAMLTVITNVVLMLVKLSAGFFGNSYALIADGIESATDIFVSLITWIGFTLSLRPPDSNHPFGHGRIETMAGFFSGLSLYGAAVIIAVNSIKAIRAPELVSQPEWFTLPVLIMVVVVKESLSRRVMSLASEEESCALKGDAWHHQSDAITSAIAAVGIVVTLILGPKYAVADSYAALLACLIIVVNGSLIIARAFYEITDGEVRSDIDDKIRAAASGIDEVRAIEKCLVRKSGNRYFVEIHVQIDGSTTVARGHEIGHEVKRTLMKKIPSLIGVTVHLEPWLGQSCGPSKKDQNDVKCSVET